MKLIVQKNNQCWLASVCMLHPELDYEELSKTYPKRGHPHLVHNWALEYLPIMLLYVSLYEKAINPVKYLPRTIGNEVLAEHDGWTIGIPPLDGEGILYVLWGSWGGHAVAYTNGWIYNPDDKRERALRPHVVEGNYPGGVWYKQPKIVQKYY